MRLNLLAAVALTALHATGCAQDEPTGTVEARLSLIEAGVVAGGFVADTYELAFEVVDAQGRARDTVVVLTDFFETEAVATLACRPGAPEMVRATLLGAYEGRPQAPRGGEGGVALIEPYVTATTFDCVADQTSTVSWPEEPSDDIMQLMRPVPQGFVDFGVTVEPPAELAPQDVVIAWLVSLRNADGVVVWEQLVRSDEHGDAHTGTFSYVGPCDAFPDTARNTLRLWPLQVSLDGAPLPRGRWRLEPVADSFDCVQNQDVWREYERALTVAAPQDGER